jgi:cobalamin synthase
MNESGTEAVILALNALGAGVLLFVSGVVQRIMNEMDEPAFKQFAQTLVLRATSDPFTVTIGTIPIFAVIYYFVMFGFHHWWFTAGIVIWMIGSSITKITNLPVYNWIKDPDNTDPGELRKKRRTLQTGNFWRAWLTLLSVVVMACQFSLQATAIAVVSCVVIAAPSVWYARRYFRE